MKRIATFRDIVKLWPNRGEFARAINVPYPTAQKMDRRDSIAVPHFDAVVAACSKIGRPDVTHDLLHTIAVRRHRERKMEREAQKSQRAA
jgi:hypothetical protein